MDKHGAVLYVGKADRLRERVRSYFVAGGGHAPQGAAGRAPGGADRLGRDLHPLEAVVREQELILEHRPPCNVHGSRPENYVYLKAGGSGPGPQPTHDQQPAARAGWHAERASASPALRARRWSSAPSGAGPGMARPWTLLHRCYPIRRCPRGIETPSLRAGGVRRLPRSLHR